MKYVEALGHHVPSCWRCNEIIVDERDVGIPFPVSGLCHDCDYEEWVLCPPVKEVDYTFSDVGDDTAPF